MVIHQIQQESSSTLISSQKADGVSGLQARGLAGEGGSKESACVEGDSQSEYGK
jgi:hypothetical protein